MELSASSLSRLSYQYLTISELVSGLEEKDLHRIPKPGKWSIHDNIAHLARYNVVFQERIKAILESDIPEFSRYAAEMDNAFPSGQQKNLRQLLDSIGGERKSIATMAGSFSPDQLKRIGIHPKFGNLTLTGWLEFFLLHEAHHIFTIFQLKYDVTAP